MGCGSSSAIVLPVQEKNFARVAVGRVVEFDATELPTVFDEPNDTHGLVPGNNVNPPLVESLRDTIATDISGDGW